MTGLEDEKRLASLTVGHNRQAEEGQNQTEYDDMGAEMVALVGHHGAVEAVDNLAVEGPCKMEAGAVILKGLVPSLELEGAAF